MTHDEVIDSGASEGYLLGELNDAERDAFEEHYFSCGVCAADVQAGEELVAGIRAQNRFVARKRVRRFSWTPPLAAAAVLMLAFIAEQQFVVLAPRVVPATMLHDLQRGEGETPNVLRGGGPIVLDFDIPPDSPSSRYECTVIDANGKTRLTLVVPEELARQTVRLEIPAGLPASEYTLRVKGANGKEVQTFRFSVRK